MTEHSVTPIDVTPIDLTPIDLTPIDAGRRTGRPRLRAAGRRPSGPVWNWRVAARCRAADAEDLFVTGAPQREARDFCFACRSAPSVWRTPWTSRSSSASGVG